MDSTPTDQREGEETYRLSKDELHNIERNETGNATKIERTKEREFHYRCTRRTNETKKQTLLELKKIK